MLTRPTHDRLQAILGQSRALSPNYSPVGATRTGEQPPGYRHDQYETDLGLGADVRARAVAGLRHWVAHTGAGAEVFPADAPLVEGGSLLVLLRAGPFHVVAPCRIVYVIDEASRFGFGYGTLPGHPEQGEEAFVVESGAGGEIRFTVTAFSRPVQALAKLGAPVSRSIQRRVTNRYLESLRRCAQPADL
jgi:uncharacterized protein (UPF0548 family)